ncbi:MAG: hypothetical protein ACRBI6_07860 [Acidimicrobiales bacterium]
MSLRDRFFTRPVAEAIMSPSGIVLAGAGAAVGIVTGLGVVGAVGLGAAAWAGRVGAAIPRGPVKPRIDRRSVTGPWQRYVDEALDAQRRFGATVGAVRSGPVRDRLDAMEDRIDTFVRHSYEIAGNGQRLADARAMVDVDRIVADLHQLTGGRPVEDGTTQARAAQALQAQLGSARRLDDTIAETRDRLVLLDARLDELVTRAIEVSVTNAGHQRLDDVDAELQHVVDELDAVRLAVQETG